MNGCNLTKKLIFITEISNYIIIMECKKREEDAREEARMGGVVGVGYQHLTGRVIR